MPDDGTREQAAFQNVTNCDGDRPYMETNGSQGY